MTLSTQPYKGARDFYPEDKQRQDYMFNTIRNVVKKHGYSEYDAPVLEPLDLYLAKTGEEIVNEQVYNFTDRGGRAVAIRPEMTPTVSRMVAARRQELSYPLRWFSIPNLWRYERPQRGRLREHWQLNVDIFGDSNVSAEFEVLAVVRDLFAGFGATPDMYRIKINSRIVINALMSDYLELDEAKAHRMIKLIDKMHKMSPEAFKDLVQEICEDDHLTKRTIEMLTITSLNDLPKEVKNLPSIESMKELGRLLQASGITNVDFDISLMRGFDYYTDIVFEVADTNPENNRSMFGGGRYDGLVGLFGVEPVPTVGFGMGDVTLANFLESNNLMPAFKNETDLVIVTIGDVYSGAANLANQLRTQNLNVSIDGTGRKIDKKIKSASKQGIKYALFVGQDELNSGEFSLKNLETGEEAKFAVEQIPQQISAPKTA